MCDSDEFDMCLDGCYNLLCGRNAETNKSLNSKFKIDLLSNFDGFKIDRYNYIERWWNFNSRLGYPPIGICTYKFNKYSPSLIKFLDKIKLLPADNSIKTVIIYFNNDVTIHIINYAKEGLALYE
ncbi:hypothetical protein LCGC14_2246330 [marine sediment metagenome]|uniref:Uncharacterized protein n=1 Tax=marine sediment metagenome TaxID=412755 RepID=A0A0F9FZ06_9ZZZZ